MSNSGGELQQCFSSWLLYQMKARARTIPHRLYGSKKRCFLFLLFSSSDSLKRGRRIPTYPHPTSMEENTRVFVSGLPPTFSNDELRKRFSTRYQVTDAHVIPKRRIGFVGFKTPTEAQDAVKYFNKTYIRMSKIAVEMARPVCSFSLPLYSALPTFPLGDFT